MPAHDRRPAGGCAASAHRRALEVAALLLAAAAAGCTEQNHQPTIDPVAPRTVRVGETLRLPILARDEDGDALAITATPMPISARLEDSDAGKVFVWPPLVSDSTTSGGRWDITFRAEDEHGAMAVRTVHIDVVREAGAPVYLGPSGYVLNLSQDEDISFVVGVKDDDSAKVDFRLIAGIDGARFQRLDEKSMSFYWKPTEAQRAQGNYWPLVVGARDESHDEVVRDLSILLMNVDAAKDCPGRPPAVLFTPLSDLHGAGAVVFKVDASDAESDVREAVVHYTTNNPLDPAAYDTLVLERCDPEADPGCPADPKQAKQRYFIGTLPSPAASATVPLLLHYYLTVVDNDDLKTTVCDQQTRAPKAGHYSLVAYPAGWTGGCKDDPYEDDDAPDAARPLDPGASLDLRACDGDEDWYRIDVPAGQVLTAELLHDPGQGALGLSLHDAAGALLAGAEGSAAVDHLTLAPTTTPVLVRVAVPGGAVGGDHSYGLVLTRAQGGCSNDGYEPNEAASQATLLGDLTTELVVCPGDRDWLKVSAGAGQTILADLEFQHQYGDLDLNLWDATGTTLLASSATATSGEHLRWDVAEGGTYAIEVLGYQGQFNSGRLTLRAVDTRTLCVEDEFSPNHTAAQAVLLPENLYEGNYICSGTQDWFRLDLNAGESLEIAVAPQVTLGGELDLQVFLDAEGKVPGGLIEEKDGVLVATATMVQDGTVSWAVSTPGPYTFQYAMQFFAADPPGECQDDRFTGNHTAKTALEVDNDVGFVTRLKLCPGGEDWFRLDAAAFEQLYVYVFGFPDEPPLQAELYRQDEDTLTPVVQGESTSNGVELLWLPEDNSEFIVHVHGEPGATNHYDLVIGLQ